MEAAYLITLVKDGHHWHKLWQQNTWERLKIRDPKINLKLLSLSLSGPLILRHTPHLLFWIFLVHCQMMSCVRFCHLKHTLSPKKHQHARYWSRDGPGLQPSQFHWLLAGCACAQCTWTRHTAWSYSQEEKPEGMPSHLFWCKFKLLERYHHRISPQSYSSCYCDMISRMWPHQQSISEVQSSIMAYVCLPEACVYDIRQ